MNILIITHNLDRASFRQRIVTFVPMLENAGIKCDFEQTPKEIIGRYKLFKKARHFDAVVLQKNALNFWEAFALRKFAKKIIYDFDDAIMFSPNKPQRDGSSHYRLFRRTARLVDCVIAGNDYLGDYARKYCNNVFVLPTGLDLKEFNEAEAAKTDDKIRLVWIGSRATLSYLSNLRDVFEEIGRLRNNVTLRIIADDFFQLNIMPVEKVKWSLNSQATDLVSCDIGLAPLPDNRFTRGKCGFKILQYFAAGLPVIASPVGVNSDFINNSKAGMLAYNGQMFKDAILKLIDDIELRKQMADTGREFVKQFDLSVIGERFVGIVRATDFTD